MKTKKLFDLLINNNLTIASAESLTGGLFAKEITKFNGASKIYKGSIIAYHNQIKHELLEVSNETLGRYGAISRRCAEEMVIGCQRKFVSDIAVSFTGNAGPQESEGKEVGLVYIGLIMNKKMEVYECHFKGNRRSIQKQCVNEIINKIVEKL